MVEKIWALESCQLGEHLDFNATRSRHIWLKHFSKRQTSYTQWFIVIFEFSLWSNRFGNTIYFRRMYNKRKQCSEWINTRKAKNWMVLLERQSQEIRGNQGRTKFQAKRFFKNHRCKCIPFLRCIRNWIWSSKLFVAVQWGWSDPLQLGDWQVKSSSNKVCIHTKSGTNKSNTIYQDVTINAEGTWTRGWVRFHRVLLNW